TLRARLTAATAPLPRPDEATAPEAELRARLLLYRAYRDAGVRLADEALLRVGLFRREPGAAHDAPLHRRGASFSRRDPGAAHAAALAGARPADAPALDPLRLVRALDRLAQLAPPPEPPPALLARTITSTGRAAVIPAP